MDAERRPSLLEGYRTEAELALELRIHPRTLQKWRYAGLGPRHALTARQILYRDADVIEWLKSGGLAAPRARQKRK
jgi:hypothetical protein